MLLGALGAPLLENLLTGKGTISAGERAIRTTNWSKFLILPPPLSLPPPPPHPLKIFEIQKYYQNEPKFNGVYLRNNLHCSWTSSKKNFKSLRKQNITTNIYTIKPYDSIMCGYFCIGFVHFMLEGKILLD